MNSDFMNLARKSQCESHNQPSDDLFWLARPSIRAQDALYLLANIQPSSFINTLERLHPWQVDALEVVFRLMQEEGIEKHEKPYLQWLKWADNHTELDFPMMTKRIKKILRAIDANIQHEADSAMPEELAIALDAWRSVSPHLPAGKAVKAALDEWLVRHQPGLSKEARSRIAIVANWNKRGGATSVGK